MDAPTAPPRRRKDDSVILHFDYDCFYAQVVENQQPWLKGVPLGIRQKQILATCNYEARRRGVRKLMGVSEACRACPDLVLVTGEDLGPFRDASRRLHDVLRAHAWSGGVERLGLDEVFVDVTDLVVWNVELLNSGALEGAFFCLDREDPLKGFGFDATRFVGHVEGGDGTEEQDPHDVRNARLLVASHLAHYLRLKLEEEGFTSACGIATNKLLAKMVGARHKPRNQTTLLATDDEAVWAFMDAHPLRGVPGFGGKMTRILEAWVRRGSTQETLVTAGAVRTDPRASPARLEWLLGGPGAVRGIGSRAWAWLHGVDDSPVKAAREVPTQISIEDTYAGLKTRDEVARELRKLAGSLVRRMRVDLVASDGRDGQAKWLATPKTLRLTTRPRPTTLPDGTTTPYGWGRTSRSRPMPRFALHADMPVEAVADRLAAEALEPMFSQLHAEARQWNVGMLNLCVTGMVPTAGGRDIGDLLRRQEDVPKTSVAYERDDDRRADEVDGHLWEEEDDFPHVAQETTEPCVQCGHLIPLFAVAAHDRFHRLEEESR